MSKLGNETAYPFNEKFAHDVNEPGLTKREVFAKAAMQGALSYYGFLDELDKNYTRGTEILARKSCAAADALLAELERTKG